MYPEALPAGSISEKAARLRLVPLLAQGVTLRTHAACLLSLVSSATLLLLVLPSNLKTAYAGEYELVCEAHVMATCTLSFAGDSCALGMGPVAGQSHRCWPSSGSDDSMRSHAWIILAPVDVPNGALAPCGAKMHRAQSSTQHRRGRLVELPMHVDSAAGTAAAQERPTLLLIIRI